MSSQHINKKPKLFLSEYLTHESEPKAKNNYDLTPELEEDLLEHGVFLKQRVWRNMSKLQRHEARLARDYGKEPRDFQLAHFHHRHHFAHS
jgi:hypothetical protein